MPADAPSSREGEEKTDPQQEDEEKGSESTVPDAVQTAVANAFDVLASIKTPIALLTHIMTALNGMDVAITQYINDTTMEMSESDLHIVHLYYDATKQCLGVANKIKHRATRVRSELRKVEISREFQKEGKLDQALTRLMDVDTKHLSFGNELDEVIATTFEAYVKVSEACKEQLQDVTMKGPQTIRKYKVVAGVCAVAGAAAVLFGLAGASYMLWASSAQHVALLSGLCEVGVVAGGLVSEVAIQRMGDIQAFHDRITAEQRRLEVARKSCSGILHSLATIQTVVKRSGSVAEDQPSFLPETGTGLSSAELDEFFSQHFGAIVNDDGELEELCTEVDGLYYTALEAFRKFAESRFQEMVNKLPSKMS